jgi:hypothetical protein
MKAIDQVLRDNRDARTDAVVQELAEIDIFVGKVIAAATEDNDPVSWEKAYNAIFSDRVSKRVYELLRRIGSSMDYYDPDTSYEEDVRAFASALSAKVAYL